MAQRVQAPHDLEDQVEEVLNGVIKRPANIQLLFKSPAAMYMLTRANVKTNKRLIQAIFSSCKGLNDFVQKAKREYVVESGDPRPGQRQSQHNVENDRREITDEMRHSAFACHSN